MPHSPGSPYLLPVLLGSTSFAFLNFSLPLYTRDLGASAVAIGGMFTVFTLSLLLFRPLVGWALDRVGRRPFFVGAFVFYALAMGLFSVGEQLTDFYVARAVQGLGASLMWVSVRTMVADLHAAGSGASAMGLVTARSVQGSILGAFVGFTLVSQLPFAVAWQWSFLGYAVLALVALGVSFVTVPETRAKPSESSRTWRVSPPVFRLLVIVFVSGFAAALIEPIYLIYLKEKFALDPLLVAAAFFPAGIVYAVLPQRAGALIDRHGVRLFVSSGIAVAAVVSLLLPTLPGVLYVTLLYMLFAAGWSFANPGLDAQLASIAGEDQRGTMFGVKEAALGVGAATGPLVGGWLFDEVSAHSAFALNGVILLVTAGLAWLWLPRRL